MAAGAEATPQTGDAPEALLAIRELRTHFGTDEGVVRAVDGVSLTLRAGQTLAVVGESGSGKSVTGLSIMGLIPNPPGRVVGGEILFRRRDGTAVDLVKLARGALLKLRGKEISMIFQEPMTSLNPVFTIGDQIAESVRLHLGKSRREARAHARNMLELVEIPAADRRLDEFPHQLSGGMRQRAMIALALANTPSLLIADEPTTALDVTIQAQILTAAPWPTRSRTDPSRTLRRQAPRRSSGARACRRSPARWPAPWHRRPAAPSPRAASCACPRARSASPIWPTSPMGSAPAASAPAR